MVPLAFTFVLLSTSYLFFTGMGFDLFHSVLWRRKSRIMVFVSQRYAISCRFGLMVPSFREDNYYFISFPTE